MEGFDFFLVGGCQLADGFLQFLLRSTLAQRFLDDFLLWRRQRLDQIVIDLAQPKPLGLFESIWSEGFMVGVDFLQAPI